MGTFHLYGGYSYNGSDTVEVETIDEACSIWLDRFLSNGVRAIDGVRFPCWGEMGDDNYAVVNFDTEETRTRYEIMLGVAE